MHILDSSLALSIYFFVGVAMVIIFLSICSKITSHDKRQLIEDNNTAASLTLSGTLLGYVISLSSAATNAVSIPDYFAWGGIALVIRLLVFTGVRPYMPALSEKTINHNTAAGMFMETAALAGGIFNTACMTWQWMIMARKRKPRNNSKIGHGVINRTGKPSNSLEPCRNHYAQKYLTLALMGGAAFLVLKDYSDSSDVDNNGDGTFYAIVQDYTDNGNNVDICAHGWNSAKTTFYADIPKNVTQQNCQSKYENYYCSNIEQSWISVVSGFLLSQVIRKDRDESFVYNSGNSSFTSRPVWRSTPGGYSRHSGFGKKEPCSSDGFTTKKVSTTFRGDYGHSFSTRGHWGD